MGAEEDGITPGFPLQKTVDVGAVGVHPRRPARLVGVDLQSQGPQIRRQAFRHGPFMVGLTVDLDIL